MLQNIGKIEASSGCTSGCTLIGVGGGGKEILCRTVTEDYKRNVLKVIKEENRGIVLRELMGEKIPEGPKLYFKSFWEMDVNITIFDSHKNDIQYLNIPDKPLDTIVENKSVFSIPDSYHGCGGDPKYGTELLEKHVVLKSIISKHLKRHCIVYMSADGGTSLATGAYLLKYKDEIHGCSEPYIFYMSFPQKQILNARWGNIEFNKEQIGDWLKRNKLSIFLYLIDHAKHVADMNDRGGKIDRYVLDIIHGRNIPRTTHNEELADLESIKSSMPLRHICMGSNEYYKMHMGSRVDIKDLLNLISGKPVIPCYLRAKSVGELSERISEINSPICYNEDEAGNRNYIPEVGIASTIFNSLAPFPKKNRVDKILYVIKMVPGMTFDYGYLLECIAKFTNAAVGVSREDIIIWTYEGKCHSNNDIEVWAYLILNDYKAYIDESIKPYALGR